MAVLTTINNIPVYSTIQEALNWAASNNLSGYHTHMVNGQIGYMGGPTHGQAAGSSQGLRGSNQSSY